VVIAIIDKSDCQINFNSLKKSATSLPAAIAIMDEFDRQINFNKLKKSATSLPTAIAIMDKSDRQIDFNSLKKSVTSLPAAIAIIDESDRQINFNSLKKSVTSLSAVIGALDSPLGPHPESDLVTNLYSSSTSIANMDESSCQFNSNSVNKYVISLSTAIRALSSPLGPYPESDLKIDIYSISTR
jgi:gamma-glutamylcysteine synthetase